MKEIQVVICFHFSIFEPLETAPILLVPKSNPSIVLIVLYFEYFLQRYFFFQYKHCISIFILYICHTKMKQVTIRIIPL